MSDQMKKAGKAASRSLAVIHRPQLHTNFMFIYKMISFSSLLVNRRLFCRFSTKSIRTPFRKASVFRVSIGLAIGAMDVQECPAVFDGVSEKLTLATLEVESTLRIDMPQV